MNIALETKPILLSNRMREYRLGQQITISVYRGMQR